MPARTSRLVMIQCIVPLSVEEFPAASLPLTRRRTSREGQLPMTTPRQPSAEEPIPDAPVVPDVFDCYELCVQSPRHVSAFLYALHGGAPLVLREDFSGAAAASLRWIRDGLARATPTRARSPCLGDHFGQYLALTCARDRGLDPDRPENLSKVTLTL